MHNSSWVRRIYVSGGGGIGPHGSTDGKVVSLADIRANQLHAICGPTHEDQKVRVLRCILGWFVDWLVAELGLTVHVCGGGSRSPGPMNGRSDTTGSRRRSTLTGSSFASPETLPSPFPFVAIHSFNHRSTNMTVLVARSTSLPTKDGCAAQRTRVGAARSSQ